VKLGITGETEVEVVEGLQEGEEIITGSYKVLRMLKDWDEVSVQQGVPIEPVKKRRSGNP